MEACPPIGSTFEWQPPSVDRAPLPRGAKLYATGRGALLAACRTIAPKSVVWLPSYFCGDVAETIHNAGFRLHIYEDLPTDREPEWHTLTPQPGEIVVIVNLLGMRDAAVWSAWRRDHQSAIFIEDHTHDPLSAWATTSTADYAFASLRKTIPVADGALLWSPTRHQLPTPDGKAFDSAAAYTFAGMVLKKSYLDSGAGDEQLYHQMRVCQNRGEELLSISGEAPISDWSRRYLAAGIPADLHRRRETNTRQFLDAFKRTSGLTGCLPLFSRWPAGQSPFNPILLFKNRELRDAARNNLIRHRVFATVHWPASRWMSPRAADIAARALTIPLDHRCDASQFGRILGLLRDVLTETRTTRLAA